MAISTSQFLNIADNIAKILVDLEAAYVTGTSAADTTVNNGVNAVSNSLFARFNALSAGDQAGAMGLNWRKTSAKVANFTGINNQMIYALVQDYLESLDFDLPGGIGRFVQQNSLL